MNLFTEYHFVCGAINELQAIYKNVVTLLS